MSDHALDDATTELSAITEGVFDPDPPKTVEAKVIAGSLVTLVASVALAELNLLQTDSAMLGGLPPWAQFAILAAGPPVATFLTGYLTGSNRV